MEQPRLKIFEQRPVLSVSQIVDQIRFRLETEFRDVWVQGEISNFRRPPSGHCYFTLKDREAQIRAVCFRLQAQALRFVPEDGLEVVARGSVSVYPPRGDFQLIVEFLQPKGQGSLQVAFEQLKARLAAEGLFDPALKKPLPRLPSKVGVVTSPSGAAFSDILRVLKRRNDRLDVLLFPAKVQGPGAALEIARAIRYLGRRPDVDVLIVGRGGGSLEDLWAFNEEVVARAIHACPKPVIAAVGHETDFTIADFVADIRAATPSAAAEMVSSARVELLGRVEHLLRRCGQAIRFLVHRKRLRLQRLSDSRAFVDAESRLKFYQQRLDDLQTRLLRTLPERFPARRQRLVQAERECGRQIRSLLVRFRQRTQALAVQLEAYSPQAALDRGYAIVTNRKSEIVRRPDQVAGGELVHIRVARGEFDARKEH